MRLGTFTSREKILARISEQLKKDLKAVFRTKNEPNYEQRLNHALFRGAALILTNEKVAIYEYDGLY